MATQLWSYELLAYKWGEYIIRQNGVSRKKTGIFLGSSFPFLIKSLPYLKCENGITYCKIE
jgi:hypothetical protein